MQIEIDQSGKIEQTNLDTVIALTNDIQYTILFKKKEKRVVEKEFRRLNLHKLHSQVTFAILIAVIIKKSKVKKSVLIDTEYMGYNEYIRQFVNDIIGKGCPLIKFGFVGKESKSDILASRVANKKTKPSYSIISSEVIKYIPKNKKSRSA